MSEMREELISIRALVDQALDRLDEVLVEMLGETGAKGAHPVSGAPTPANAPQPKSAPKADAPAVSSEVMLLANTAMAEALSLKDAGHNLSEIITQVKAIQWANSIQAAHDGATVAIGALEPLQDKGVDVSALRDLLRQIEAKTSDGFGGNVPEGEVDVRPDVVGSGGAGGFGN